MSGEHNCKHQHYCIFNKNRTELESQIITLKCRINEFQHIKDCYINNEIIYNTELKDQYIIDKEAYVSTDGEIHYKVGVNVTDNFMGVVNRKLDNLKYDLKNLEAFKLSVIHGKVKGYGYGDVL